MAPPRDAERAEREAARTAAPVASLERPRVGAGGWIRMPNKGPAGLMTVRRSSCEQKINREKVVGNVTLGGVAEVREERREDAEDAVGVPGAGRVVDKL